MALREDMEKQGSWLFRWRSYLPLLGIPIFIIALRQSGALERRFGDAVGDSWGACAIIVSFLGLIVRCITAGYAPRGTSGRNTKSQVAEMLNTTGMYSISRNPLYLGNFIIVLGITLFIQVWWLALLVWFGFWLYYERIIFTEEEFLRSKFKDQFLQWAAKTPIVIPCFKNWKKPELGFSFKTVLRREFSTYFSIVTTFFFLEISTNFLTKKRFTVNSSWIIFFIISLGIYLTFYILKKKTKLLNVTGR
ncbi:MAG: isoprenylcysteine carboxylmethyltransferase family protein [Candidatus Omnitrophica bacterium]|nr:isoprenylcysteine carboxylmethyltransferase family protein [Candidatus Omnitrophota bacterium]